MKKIILFIWQLPQNFLGFLLSRKASLQIKVKNKTIYYKKFLNSGVSLGQFIILDNSIQSSKDLLNIIFHEIGHSKQSLYLGWLYLPVIGLPSFFRNIYARIFKKNDAWYYSGFPENWADKLGNVNRKT